MSTLTTVITEEKPLVLRSRLIDSVHEDDRNVANSTPAFYASLASLLGFVSPVLITLDVSASTAPASFTAMAIFGTLGFFVGRFQAMKKLAVIVAKRDTNNTHQQDAEMVETINKYTKFPCGQYLKLNSSPAVKHPDNWLYPNEFTWSEAGCSTHTKEDGIVFTLKGAYLQHTISKNVNKVWDDALDAVIQVHGISR